MRSYTATAAHIARAACAGALWWVALLVGAGMGHALFAANQGKPVEEALDFMLVRRWYIVALGVPWWICASAVIFHLQSRKPDAAND